MRTQKPARPSSANEARLRRFPRPRRPGEGGSSLIWMVAGGVIVGLVILIGLGWVFLPRPGASTPVPTSSAAPASTAIVTGTAPAVLTPPSPTPAPPPTAVPITCRVIASTWVRNKPSEEDSIGLARVKAGDEVQIIGTEQKENDKWYRLGNYPQDAYIRAEAVQCPTP